MGQCYIFSFEVLPSRVNSGITRKHWTYQEKLALNKHELITKIRKLRTKMFVFYVGPRVPHANLKLLALLAVVRLG
jgi:hypothetical protein